MHEPRALALPDQLVAKTQQKSAKRSGSPRYLASSSTVFKYIFHFNLSCATRKAYDPKSGGTGHGTRILVLSLLRCLVSTEFMGNTAKQRPFRSGSPDVRLICCFCSSFRHTADGPLLRGCWGNAVAPAALPPVLVNPQCHACLRGRRVSKRPRPPGSFRSGIPESLRCMSLVHSHSQTSSSPTHQQKTRKNVVGPLVT